MYCKYCGQELAEGEDFCPNCGKKVNEDNLPVVVEEKVEKKTEKVSFGWAVLGFFFPIVGLILFIVWKAEHLSIARKAGIGAIAGVVTEVIVSFVAVIISIIATVIPLVIVYGGVVESMLI